MTRMTRISRPDTQDLEGGVILVGPERPPEWLLRELDGEGLPAAFVQKTDYDGTGREEGREREMVMGGGRWLCC